jgi:tyrosyl-DNA phosphodiesterase-1
MPIQRTLKKRRVDDGSGTIASMSREVSPPARSTPVPKAAITSATTEDDDTVDEEDIEDIEDDDTEDEGASENTALDQPSTAQNASKNKQRVENAEEDQGLHQTPKPPPRYIPSAFQLTRIKDLLPAHNVDTITLHDILGHPLLSTVWQFNYLHSIPFICKQFDPDARPHIALHIVHGFWRNDDGRKQSLQEQAVATKQASGVDVKLVAAHMPEMFGTHHCKMMVLFRRDGVAQVVIHTANMIEQDWGNLTQAVWRSPELPLLPEDHDCEEDHTLGSGTRFKADLLKYLGVYEGRTRTLVAELKKYDFGSIRAALIASVPSKISLSTADRKTSAWGWPGLKQIFGQIVPEASKSQGAKEGSTINVQISSIATLTDKWIQNFLEVLDTRRMPHGNTEKKKSRFNIIFPTAEEIRRSLDGYSSGDSIHMKLQSVAQQKQLQILKPMLRHWHSGLTDSDSAMQGKREAYRNSAAPHIKTYMRFADSDCKSLEWAMISSANLSQQAWGFMADKDGKVRIASYEIGVVIWPELFRDDKTIDGKMVMVPMFGKDMPEPTEAGDGAAATVGIRMPYDLPLVPYAKEDVPWCATMPHKEPDWKGSVWAGYQDRM